LSSAAAYACSFVRRGFSFISAWTARSSAALSEMGERAMTDD
jgi:hypothetical protein